MKELFQTVLYQPIFNIFVGFYNLIPDIGAVILIITLIIRLALYPLTRKSIEAQKSLTDLQPKLEEIKKKHQGNQQLIAQETMRVYKENKVNPLGSCLPLLIQLPIFIAIYWVLKESLTGQDFSRLYSFIKSPEHINTTTLGLIDLGKSNLALALLAGAAQFWQAKMMQSKRPPKEAGAGGKDEGMMSMMNKQMLYFMPALTVIVSMSLPGGLALYWFLSTFFTALQQKIMFKKNRGPDTPIPAAVTDNADKK